MNRYERASLIVSSNKPISAWTEIFGDAVAVAAMVHRLVHHAEIINLKGDSYRLKGRRKEATTDDLLRFRPSTTAQHSAVVDTTGLPVAVRLRASSTSRAATSRPASATRAKTSHGSSRSASLLEL